MSNINIIADRCTGCKACIEACPFGVIRLDNKKAVMRDNCRLCGACLSSCEFGALVFKKYETQEYSNISDYKGIWIFGEQRNGTPVSVVMELLGQGRKLADQLRVPLSVVLLCENGKEAANTLIACGADIVYLVNNPALKQFNDEVYTDVFVQLVNQYKPEIVLIGATAYGRSFAPRVSSRLGTGLTADCTGLEIDMEKRLLLQTRPAFGGSIMASIVCPEHRPQMATVRPRVMEPLSHNQSRIGEIIEPNIIMPKNIRTNVIEIVSSMNEMLNLLEADVIVSAGRGIGEAKNLDIIKELANVLGAAVGASRAIVDSGWIDFDHQIGQTGKTVRPRVYFACGISGAIQHLAGMSSSDIIIAINKNSDAPIFKAATFGIVGDVLEVVPALTKELKLRRG